MDGFARYLTSLACSWEALAAPHADACVVRDRGFVAARFPRHPVLNNAALLEATAVKAVGAFFDGVERYALWSCDQDTDAALAAAGLRRDVTTRPMLCRLDRAPAVPLGTEPIVLGDLDPSRIADLNGVAADVLEGIPGLRAFASEGYQAGLVLVAVDTDVNISFVATHPNARRRGLASSLA